MLKCNYEIVIMFSLLNSTRSQDLAYYRKGGHSKLEIESSVPDNIEHYSGYNCIQCRTYCKLMTN